MVMIVSPRKISNDLNRTRRAWQSRDPRAIGAGGFIPAKALIFARANEIGWRASPSRPAEAREAAPKTLGREQTFSLGGSSNETMPAPYRDDADALEARHAALSEELSAVQSKTRELGALQKQEAALSDDLADVRRRLEKMGSRRALPLLESLRIASPCTESWDEMTGDDRVRFCASCRKDVYNLAGMARDEAERLVRERAGDVCIRLYKREDGTVLTSDCPVGQKRKRRRRLAMAVVGGGVAAAGALYAATASVTMGGVRPHPAGLAPAPDTTLEPDEPPPPNPPAGLRPRMGAPRMGKMSLDYARPPERR
jgi:hypothetical protein